ncbi:hypothetical protein TNCV_2449571 [Trichonephila clavipes]|uniref:Uncharacterized protein n=1 Tax=Trichonephila clavipes TaxID=2585209 RepID=A0A8X6UZY5_TRICX|nr:hypothetical protein TNCV_2449571 [Trichonephila clavipes]
MRTRNESKEASLHRYRKTKTGIRQPNRSDHKRGLPSSISSNLLARKRNRRMENNGQVLARGSEPDPAEERPLQSSRIQPLQSEE